MKTRLLKAIREDKRFFIYRGDGYVEGLPYSGRWHLTDSLTNSIYSSNDLKHCLLEYILYLRLSFRYKIYNLLALIASIMIVFFLTSCQPEAIEVWPINSVDLSHDSIEQEQNKLMELIESGVIPNDSINN